LANIYNVDKYVAANVVHIDGVAGAGKSEVALKAIKKRFNLKDEDMLVVGPTSS
jgi:serine kinase of HPr protein (carbohydrate metabolism regulator)